jgi:hypothetical protein
LDTFDNSYLEDFVGGSQQPIKVIGMYGSAITLTAKKPSEEG